ncbi:hypothetical protein SCT_0409 [Sulfuricella sp. T08]|uniref:hypothetical protein n=1 Tax=Sulfuricella sp. T08 TaxID=1632857 RepID=UPI00061797CF|nr:hypothetical protein [Sulfuricella sp. T08]GAO35028.1 hypothetical protein SCT_0409 [Sulfuricella sp. T08]
MIRTLSLILLCLALPLTSWAAGEAVAYTSLAITQPAAEETIHGNTGTLVVELTLSPALQIEQGHRIKLLLDGTAMPVTGTTSLTLTEIDRGAHTLQAAVEGQSGEVLILSEPVSFYMWRASALFRRY